MAKLNEVQKRERMYQEALQVLRIIEAEPYELSHEKIVNQRDWFKKQVKRALDRIAEIHEGLDR